MVLIDSLDLLSLTHPIKQNKFGLSCSGYALDWEVSANIISPFVVCKQGSSPHYQGNSSVTLNRMLSSMD